jgi:hypothetical protein
MGNVRLSKKGQIGMIGMFFILIVFNIIYFAGLAGVVQSLGVSAYTESDSLFSWFAGNLNLFIIIIDIVSVFAIARYG